MKETSSRDEGKARKQRKNQAKMVCNRQLLKCYQGKCFLSKNYRTITSKSYSQIAENSRNNCNEDYFLSSFADQGASFSSLLRQSLLSPHSREK